jgi:hypothetical protein
MGYCFRLQSSSCRIARSVQNTLADCTMPSPASARLPPYVVTPAIRKAAAAVGVRVVPSTSARHKLDAYSLATGAFQNAFGGAGYADYHVYLRTHGPEYAARRRALYWQRHAKDAARRLDRHGKLSRGFLSARVLW